MIVYSPMASGLLTGSDDPRAHRRNSGRATGANGRRVSGAAALAATSLRRARCSASPSGMGAAPGAVAIAWTLRNPAVDGAIVGLRRPEQVDELLGAASLQLGDEGLEVA